MICYRNLRICIYMYMLFGCICRICLCKYIYIYIHLILNFTRSWNFGILRVYWVLKSKCIISSNLPAQGSCSKVLTVAIFVESMVHGRRWPSRGLETVGNSRKQSETVGSGPAGSCQNCQSAVFFDKKNCSRKTHFFWRVQRETVGNSWGLYLWLGKKRAV